MVLRKQTSPLGVMGCKCRRVALRMIYLGPDHSRPSKHFHGDGLCSLHEALEYVGLVDLYCASGIGLLTSVLGSRSIHSGKFCY